MRSYQLSIFGVEVSFKAQADPQDVEKARAYVEKEAERLKGGGGLQSKDKLLALLALGVAYDLLQLQQRLQSAEDRIESLLRRIEQAT